MRRSFLSLLVFVAVVGLAPSLFAQGEGAVYGQVLASEDGSLLPDVTVRLERADMPAPAQVNTAEDGQFAFRQLAPGEYVLTAHHPDFLEERVRLALKPRELRNVILSLTLRPLNVVVQVTAEPISLPSTHSPSSTVLQETQLARSPLAGRNSIPNLVVTAAPGMIRGHDDFVHVRGSEMALNTFINDVSFWENEHALFSGGLGPGVIHSANVMTGGFSAEYGNRFGGVLDIVTKSGFSSGNEGSLTLGIGSALRHNLAMEYSGHAGRFAYYLSSSTFESARFLSPPERRSIHDTGRGSHNFLQLDVHVNPNNSLTLLLMADGTNFQIPKTAMDDAIRPNANAFQRTRQQTSILSWTRVLSKDSLLHTSFYQRWSRSLLLPAVDRLAASAFSDRRLLTTGVRSDLTRFFGRHTFKGGIDLVLLQPNEKLSYDATGYMRLARTLQRPHVHLPQPIRFSGEKSGGQLSLYLQDGVQLSDRLTMDAGLRYDQYSLAVSTFHLSPRLNLAYRFSKESILHASYNRFFVPPPVENLLASSAGLTRLVSGIGKSLGPLRAMVEDQVELGVTHPIHPCVLAGVTGYYRSGDHPLHTVLFPDSRIYAYANFDREHAYGLEVKLDLRVPEKVGLSGYLNYALGRVYLYDPVTGGFVAEASHAVESGRFLAPMDQTHTLNAGFTYRHRGSGLWAGMLFEYGSGTPTGRAGHGGMEMTAPLPQRVPAHFTQNVSLGVDLPAAGERARCSLQFNIENLTDNVYRIAQESVFSPGQYFMPRFLSGSLKIRF